MSEEKVITKETPFKESVINTQATAARSLIHETLHFDESIADEYGAARAEQAEAKAEQISAPVTQIQSSVSVQSMPVQSQVSDQTPVSVQNADSEQKSVVVYEEIPVQGVPVQSTVADSKQSSPQNMVSEQEKKVVYEEVTVQRVPAQSTISVQEAALNQGTVQTQNTVQEQKLAGMAHQTSENQSTASTMTGTAKKMEDTAYEKESAEDQAAEREYTEAVKDPEDRSEKIKQIKNLFHHSTRRKFSREEVILSRISDDQLMEYLTLEQRRQECLQKARESRNEKLLLGFQLAAVLCAIVGVVWLLKDNPVVLVNILYIIGIVIAIWIWKNPGKPGKH